METTKLECADCYEMFDPFLGGKVFDGFNTSTLAGVTVALCAKCWKIEAKRRGLI